MSKEHREILEKILKYRKFKLKDNYFRKGSWLDCDLIEVTKNMYGLLIIFKVDEFTGCIYLNHIKKENIIVKD